NFMCLCFRCSPISEAIFKRAKQLKLATEKITETIKIKAYIYDLYKVYIFLVYFKENFEIKKRQTRQNKGKFEGTLKSCCCLCKTCIYSVFQNRLNFINFFSRISRCLLLG